MLLTWIKASSQTQSAYVCHLQNVTYHMMEAIMTARWSLKGVRRGSPSSRLAMMLPAKHTSMDESQLDRGCLRWNGVVCPPAAVVDKQLIKYAEITLIKISKKAIMVYVLMVMVKYTSIQDRQLDRGCLRWNGGVCHPEAVVYRPGTI